MTRTKSKNNKYIKGLGSAIKESRKKEKEKKSKRAKSKINTSKINIFVMLVVAASCITLFSIIGLMFCYEKYDWGITALSAFLMALSFIPAKIKSKDNNYLIVLLVGMVISLVVIYLLACKTENINIEYYSPYISVGCLIITIITEFGKAYIISRNNDNKRIDEINNENK